MQQVAEIRSENARVQEARAAYYPALTLNVTPAIPSLYGSQFPYPWSHTADLVGELRFNLQWTVFDGVARKNRLAQDQPYVLVADAPTNAKRNQMAENALH